MADLAPETALERQYAQTFCDTQWRLNRARSYEDSMLALGHFEGPAVPGIDHPDIQNALAAAKVFRENSKAFVNLSLYEQHAPRPAAEGKRSVSFTNFRRSVKPPQPLIAENNSQLRTKQKSEPAENTPGQFVFRPPKPRPNHTSSPPAPKAESSLAHRICARAGRLIP